MEEQEGPVTPENQNTQSEPESEQVQQPPEGHLVPVKPSPKPKRRLCGCCGKKRSLRSWCYIVGCLLVVEATLIFVFSYSMHYAALLFPVFGDLGRIHVYIREINPPERIEWGPLLTLGVVPSILLILGAALLHQTCCTMFIVFMILGCIQILADTIIKTLILERMHRSLIKHENFRNAYYGILWLPTIVRLVQYCFCIYWACRLRIQIKRKAYDVLSTQPDPLKLQEPEETSPPPAITEDNVVTTENQDTV